MLDAGSTSSSERGSASQVWIPDKFGAARRARRRASVRVGDAMTSRHQIDCARLDPLAGAEAVAMLDGAGEQIGDRRQVDVRVRGRRCPAGRQPGRAHLVEEDERPDHGPLLVRERAVYLEAAKVVGDRRKR